MSVMEIDSKKHTTWLVDTENNGGALDVILRLINEKGQGDKIILFVSPNTSIAVKDLALKRIKGVKTIFCEVSGTDALDFCLDTYLGYAIRSHKKRRYVIVSYDHGYDNVVRFWNNAGCEVARTDENACCELVSTDIQVEPTADLSGCPALTKIQQKKTKTKQNAAKTKVSKYPDVADAAAKYGIKYDKLLNAIKKGGTSWLKDLEKCGISQNSCKKILVAIPKSRRKQIRENK